MVGSMEPRTSEQQSRLTVDMQVEVIGNSKVAGLLDYWTTTVDCLMSQLWRLVGTWLGWCLIDKRVSEVRQEPGRYEVLLRVLEPQDAASLALSAFSFLTFRFLTSHSFTPPTTPLL